MTDIEKDVNDHINQGVKLLDDVGKKRKGKKKRTRDAAAKKGDENEGMRHFVPITDPILIISRLPEETKAFILSREVNDRPAVLASHLNLHLEKLPVLKQQAVLREPNDFERFQKMLALGFKLDPWTAD